MTHAEDIKRMLDEAGMPEVSLRETIKFLTSFFRKGEKGETRKLLNEGQAEKLNGISEPLYATLVSWDSQRAVIVHFGLNGDWTKAVTLTEDTFANTEGEVDFSVEEALEWFFRF